MPKYLNLTFRRIKKNGLLGWINIVGLSIGFASIFLIATYIFGELRIGKTQTDYQELYTLQSGDGTSHSYKCLSAIKENIPEFNSFTSFHSQWSKAYIALNGNKIEVKSFLFADEEFFKVFEHNPIIGDLSTALNSKNSLVLTRSMAMKVFGKIPAIGSSVLFQSDSFGNILLTINAIVDDLDSKSILDFQGVISDATIKDVKWYKRNLNHWGNSNRFVFCRLNKGIVTQTEDKINQAVNEAAPDWYLQDHESFSLSNISEQYFNKADYWGVLKKGNKSNIYSLAIIVCFLIVIAWINYINIATSQREKSGLYFRIKRSLGASKNHLMIDGINGVLPSILVALIFALLILSILIPPFNTFTSTKYAFNDLFQPTVLMLSLFFVAATIIICGIIPAILQKEEIKKQTNKRLRGSLSVFQFCLSIGLIICTLLISKQHRFMESYSSGFSSENIIYIPLRGNAQNKADILGERLKTDPNVLDVTFASGVLGNVSQGWGMTLDNEGQSNRISYDALRVSANFFDFFELDITEGTGFLESSIKECHHIFNQAAIQQYGIKDINKTRIASYGNANGNIIGTVEDFNFKSIHHPITALGFVMQPIKSLNYIYLKLNSSSVKSIQGVLGHIEKEWQVVEPEWPVEINFLNQTMKGLYAKDRVFGKLIILAAILSILISCIGLFGVCKYIAEERTKEIGIRKVNGAKISDVLAMLNKDFVKWVAIAFVIACPIAYYAMTKWLENFAYKTTLSWWIFALAGVLALGIALLTVSWQSWRAATRNPVEALRYE